MRHPTNHLLRDDGGSVLMETVLAIPILLVTIGAVLWMGDLSLSRHRLLIADRFAAWNAGNRHGGAAVSEDALWQRLFDGNEHQTVRKVRLRSKDQGWYAEVKGTVNLRTSMPPATHGMIHAGASWDAGRILRQRLITGRDGPHLIVMRGGERDQGKEEVNWISVRLDNWWPGLGGRGDPGARAGGFAKQDQYDRFGTFVSWSN